LDQLRLQEFHYYSREKKLNSSTNSYRKSNVVTVRAIFEEAAKQLRLYMNAIGRGKAYQGTAPEGVSDKRIRVEVVGPSEAEEVIGFVFCGIGSRIVTMLVEPDVVNVQHRFRGIAEWQRSWQG
jgi:hypothetical protein